MARVAQAFTATSATLTVQPHEIKRVPDIEYTSEGTTSVFTGGVGTISPELAADVDEALSKGLSTFRRGQRVKPTCYQVSHPLSRTSS